MIRHLRYAGHPTAIQDRALRDIVAQSPMLRQTLETARDIDLPDWWLVSGAIYNTVWNHLTDRPALHGIKDIDLFYFDPDTSYEAEDRVISNARFPGTPPVEIRNQARVHLWYPGHFGQPYSALTHSAEAIDRFASRTHCIGLRLTDRLEIYAPYGLDDIFSFRLTPNPILNNRTTHEEKAARQMLHWPDAALDRTDIGAVAKGRLIRPRRNDFYQKSGRNLKNSASRPAVQMNPRQYSTASSSPPTTSTISANRAPKSSTMPMRRSLAPIPFRCFRHRS